MKLYLSIIKFNGLKLLAYPFEILAFFFSRLTALGFLALFWYALANSTGGEVDFKPLIAYFLVAAAIRELTVGNETKLGRFIQRLILQGEINNYFIKPVKTIPFLLFSFIGDNWMGFIYALATILLGLIILPPLSLLNILAFIVFLILALVISICFNVLIGIISFYSPEATGFRNVFNLIRFCLALSCRSTCFLRGSGKGSCYSPSQLLFLPPLTFYKTS